MTTAWLELTHNPKFLPENVKMVSEGDEAFEAELKQIWTSEVKQDLSLLEQALREGAKDHQTVWLLVGKVNDSGCVMGAEGVRAVASEMLRWAGERRYDRVAELIPEARREFEEFNILWSLYKRALTRPLRKDSIF